MRFYTADILTSGRWQGWAGVFGKKRKLFQSPSEKYSGSY